MFLKTINIGDETLVTEIVMRDYRTAGVFGKYGIDYCCGGKQPLEKVCEIRGLDINLVKEELYNSLRNIHVSNSINFKDWSIDFLVDFIINVHHSYLVINLPEITTTLKRFAEGHQSKYPWLPELIESFNCLYEELLPHLAQEEKIIFPYIKQIVHAHASREPYAGLLVRTLRKPIETMISHEQDYIAKYLYRFRELTNNYTPPLNACITHKVTFSKLKELDTDIVQHVYFENEILFPKAIQIEKELKEIDTIS